MSDTEVESQSNEQNHNEHKQEQNENQINNQPLNQQSLNKNEQQLIPQAHASLILFTSTNININETTTIFEKLTQDKITIRKMERSNNAYRVKATKPQSLTTLVESKALPQSCIKIEPARPKSPTATIRFSKPNLPIQDAQDIVRKLAGDEATIVRIPTNKRDSSFFFLSFLNDTATNRLLARNYRTEFGMQVIASQFKQDRRVPRCHKCKNRSHGDSPCGTRVCGKCGADHKEPKDCIGPKSCGRCRGPHHYTSEKCRLNQQFFEQQSKSTNKMNIHPERQPIINRPPNVQPRTWSSVVAPSQQQQIQQIQQQHQQAQQHRNSQHGHASLPNNQQFITKNDLNNAVQHLIDHVNEKFDELLREINKLQGQKPRQQDEKTLEIKLPTAADPPTSTTALIANLEQRFGSNKSKRNKHSRQESKTLLQPKPVKSPRVAKPKDDITVITPIPEENQSENFHYSRITWHLNTEDSDKPNKPNKPTQRTDFLNLLSAMKPGLRLLRSSANKPVDNDASQSFIPLT